MRDYKGFTAKERYANLEKVKKAIRDGLLESPYNLKCERCGQDKGVREYHCYDYTPEKSMESLTCLCWRCHRNLHTYEIGESHKYYNYAVYYFKEVDKGRIFPPVYTKYYTKEREEQMNEDKRDANK